MEKRKKYTLLYIEDDALVRKMAVTCLRERFSEIYEATNATEGFAIYRREKPDIILTDIRMPGMSGLSLCEKIREEDERTPVIIMSAYSQKEYLLRATELNLVRYLIKPVSEEALEEAIALAEKKLHRGGRSVVSVGEGYLYDAFNHALVKESRLIPLTALQSKLIATLIENRGQIVSYTQLERELYHDTPMSKDAIRSLVKDIRRVSYKGIIENISKTGYRINLDG